MTVPEILEDALKYKSYMRFSGGGFTASGGDPLLQHKFVTELFKQLKENGVHTALDTSGYAETSDIEELISYTDLVLLDIKSIIPEKYFDLTAVKLEYTLKFAEFLKEKNVPVWIRYVVVPGYTDEQEDVEALAQYLKTLTNVQKVELLPFHKLGEHKWETMNLPYKLRDVPVPGKDVMENLEGIIKNYGLPM
jgi:pyruvate formate lyase activating enzyme